MKNIIICVISIIILVLTAHAQIDFTHGINTTAGASKISITTATTTIVKGTNGILHRIIIGTPISLATVKIFDIASGGCTGTPGSGLVQTITLPTTLTNGPFYEYDMVMNSGICIVTSGATDVLVTFE